MTESKDSDDAERSKNELAREMIMAWAAQIQAAEAAFKAQFADRSVPRETGDDLQNTAVYLVHWLARVFADGEVSPVEAAIIRRLRAAILPPLDGEKTALACKLVEAMARRHRDTGLESVASDLVVLLRHLVHEAFGALELGSVVELLARFEPTKARRTSDGKLGKLSAAGILCALNEKARWPLGRALTAKQVANSLRLYGEHVTPEVT